MLQPQAGSFSNAGSSIAQQASAFAEAAATSATDGLLLDLDTLWSFVQEVRPRHAICVHELSPRVQTLGLASCTQTCVTLASLLGDRQGSYKCWCQQNAYCNKAGTDRSRTALMCLYSFAVPRQYLGST